MRICYARREVIFLATLLFFSFVVRVLFFSHPGFISDLNTFEYWFNTAATYGLRPFYNVVSWVDYPPFNIYIFWVFGSIAKGLSLFGTNLMRYIIKLPPNIFDLATSTLIFSFVRKRSDLKMASIATALYAFNPALILNAAVWGQFDAIYTFFLVLSLFLVFESKPKLAVVAFMLGILTKPQSVALAPLMVFLIFRKYNWRGLITSIGVAFVTVFAVILPLEWTSGNPVTFLSDIYFGAYSNYAYTTFNAFNIWAFGGMMKPDTTIFLFTNLNILGWMMFAALAALTLYFVYKRLNVSEESVVLFSAFLLFFGFFMLPTRIHERYLFPAFSVMALLIPFVRKIRPVYVILTGTYLINQAYVLSLFYAGNYIAEGDPVVLLVSLINLVVFLYVLFLTWGALRNNNWLNSIYMHTGNDVQSIKNLLYSHSNKVLHFFGSQIGKILLIGLASRILVFVSAIFGSMFVGIVEPTAYDVQLPFVNLFSTWDAGQYSAIALGGYSSASNPLAIHWAWFPLYPFLMGIGGKIFFGVLSPVESVILTGFLLSNILFFVCLILFYKLSEMILGNKKLALLSSVFFSFWPGSLFYSCVYSESLFMTLTLGAFYFLEKQKEVKSTLLGFLAGLTKSSGLLIVVPFLYNFIKKRTDASIYQVVFVALPYLLFNLVGNVFTGVFPVRDIVYRQYWGSQSFFLLQLFEIEPTYAILFFIEFCLVLVPFIYLFLSKELLVSVFSLGIKGERKDAKYFGFAFAQLILLLFFSIVANVHRYAIPILPLYWVFAKIWNKKPKLGIISLALMISLLVIGTILFSTWRWYW